MKGFKNGKGKIQYKKANIIYEGEIFNDFP